MTDVRFYHNAPDRLRVACVLTAKASSGGRRVAVFAPDGGVARHFDQMLWTFQPLARWHELQAVGNQDRRLCCQRGVGAAVRDEAELAAAPETAVDLFRDFSIGRKYRDRLALGVGAAKQGGCSGNPVGCAVIEKDLGQFSLPVRCSR